ncbi:Uncharacterised protein [Klebsiella pneumoniae subsp. rhinoscleromatis]|nr:Uncharacterised protein [Klebsiella pneumoniae subsp. rhinoscleromatis]
MKPSWPTVRCVAYSPGRMPCIAIMKPLPTPGRSLSAADCIVRSVTTRCCRWRRTGGSSAAANSSAVTTGRGARKSSSGCIPSRRSSPSSPNRFRTGSAITSITICCATSATTFASWWRSPTRCSRGLDIDELVSEVGERDPSLLPDRRHQRGAAQRPQGEAQHLFHALS